MFTPSFSWRNDPIWRLHMYQMGLKLQPPTRLFTMYIYISQHIPTYIPPKKTQPEVTWASPEPRLPRLQGSFAPSTAFNRMRHAASALVNAGESPISPASWCWFSTRGFFVVLKWYWKSANVCSCFRDVFFWICLGFFFLVGLEFWVGKCFWCCQVLWRRYFCIQMFYKMTFCVWGIRVSAIYARNTWNRLEGFLNLGLRGSSWIDALMRGWHKRIEEI